MPGAGSRALLLTAIDDPEPWVRYFAAISLGRIGDSSSLDILGRIARADPAPHVSVAAIEAIGTIGGDDARRILEPIAETERGDRGHAAVRVLGRVRNTGIPAVVLTALRSDDVQRRAAAVQALTLCESPESVEPLKWTAAADSDPGVAGAALAGLGAKTAQAAPAGQAAVQGIAACLCEPGRRDDALTTLARLPPSAIPWLADGLAADDPRIRRGVVEALGRLSHPAASAYLQRAISDADAVVRRHAIAALSRIGTQGLTGRLAALAQSDPSDTVRQAAAAAIHRRGNDAAGAGE
jgi:HEAT repeat protein